MDSSVVGILGLIGLAHDLNHVYAMAASSVYLCTRSIVFVRVVHSNLSRHHCDNGACQNDQRRHKRGAWEGGGTVIRPGARRVSTNLTQNPILLLFPQPFFSSTTTMASSASTTDIDFANMPPRTADLEETWAYLSRGVEHIMTNFELGLSFKGYTSLYSTVYNYCTSTKMHGKLDGNRSTYLLSVNLRVPLVLTMPL